MATHPPLRGDGPFSSEAGFADFLSDTGRDPSGEEALPARNFLLDEGVSAERVESYRAEGGIAAHGGVASWRSAHGSYVAARVNRPHSGSIPERLDPADPDECPETFVHIDPGSPYLLTDPGVHLLRTIEVGTIASRAKQPAATIERLAQELTNKPGAEPARTQLDDILQEFARACDLRPAFAAFWEDFSPLFGKTPADDEKGWADTLRDRCGLSFMDPRTRGRPIPILVFRYPVKDVPKRRGTRDAQPLVPPTVLDATFFPPFCPAPRNTATGIAVDLSGDSGAKRREVVHPCPAFRAAHVFRAGVVRRPFDLDIKVARWIHLEEVRALSGRADYADGTDGDLLR